MATYKTINGKKGKRIQVFVRIRGYKDKYKTFDTKSEAKIWATEIEAAMKKGTYKEDNSDQNLSNKHNIKTVGELIEYFENNEATDRYADPNKYTAMYEWWKNKIGNISLNNLSTSALSHYKDILAAEPPDKPYKDHKTKSNSTVNKYLFALSAILTYAKNELELIQNNPMSMVKKKKKSKGRTRFLSKDEVKKLIGACKNRSQRLFIFVLILITTGARFSEVRHLKVENIDFDNALFHFLDTKNGENRGVPADISVLSELKQYLSERIIAEGYIFLNDKKTNLAYMRGELNEVIKELDLEDFHPHDIRHTLASYVAMSGGSLLDIAEILGHKSLTMARRYSHLTKKHTSTVLSKVNSNILDLG